MQRILCFGDSLTEGMVWGQMNFHPYTLKLEEKLKAGGYQFEIENYGVSGERTGSMVTRFGKLLSERDYTIAIILGGTNDLGDRQAETTINNLISMHSVCLRKNIRSVVVTIPEMRPEVTFNWITPIRTSINDKLKEFSSAYNLPLIDLPTAIPHNSLPEAKRKKIWSDGLHLTKNGYDRFGEIVYDTLVTMLSTK
eukprot:Phypoly_transcript_17490.p1 GENE.Phypoly_transcript_17490~~Phypoly_transcript_17490.p1  ORF type:complete len:196 (+),score=11.38 Phypoly_transcript_17490:179-766(+)